MEDETPPWERQKHESIKAYTYYRIYQELPDFINEKPKTYNSIIHFIENEQYLKNTKINKVSHNFLLKARENIPIPTYNQLSAFAMRWKWQERLRKYHNFQVQMQEKQKDERYNDLNDRLDRVDELLIDNIEQNATELKYDDSKTTSKSHATNSLAQAEERITKNIRLRYGRSTENNNNQDNVDLKVSGEINQNITNLDSKISQKIIMNPKYVELTRELLEDLTDDRPETEDS